MSKKQKLSQQSDRRLEDKKILEDLALAGMDAVRLNFSHGDLRNIKNEQTRCDRFLKKIGKTIAVIQDLGGPKVRVEIFTSQA